MSATLLHRRRDRPAAAFIVASETDTNERLRRALAATGVEAAIVPPGVCAEAARFGDLVIGRLDVLPTLDGVEPGLDTLRDLRLNGIAVVNGADSLLACHDKLSTARLLADASLPQPRSVHLPDAAAAPELEPPYVLKPRFGSWGSDVYRCDSRAGLAARLELLADRPWFRRHGVLVQELIEPRGFDLRLIVSAGAVVGAVERVAAPGEWRTNVALGGSRRPVVPPSEACTLAIHAAAAVGADLVGVDLLPVDGEWLVLELNGAVDFTDDYALDGDDVFARAVAPLVELPDAVPRGVCV